MRANGAIANSGRKPSDLASSPVEPPNDQVSSSDRSVSASLTPSSTKKTTRKQAPSVQLPAPAESSSASRPSANSLIANPLSASSLPAAPLLPVPVAKATPQQSDIQSRTQSRDVTVAVSEAESAIVPSHQPNTNKSWFGRLPKIIRSAVWAVVFGSTALTAAGLGTIAVLTFPLPRRLSGDTVAPQIGDLWRSGFRYQVSRPVNILVMGLDEATDVEGAQPGDLVGRTDTMLLVRVNPEDKALNVMSIPRDTRVEIPGYGVDKINQANFEGGAELAAETVAHNFNNVEIDRYVRVSTVAFKEIVDLVGGVEVLVPKEMKYEDKTQGLVIDLEPGLQMLDGDEAEQFARFRQDSYGDIGRVQRQQILLKALRQRLMNPTVLPKLPQIIRVLQRYIDTNLSVEELLALAGFGLNLDAKDLHMVMLPGEFSDPEEYGASYWLADYTASSDLMRTYFNAKPAELVAAEANGVNYFEAPADWAVEGLQIAVQNATDDQYASYSMAEYLRDQGFYNVYVMRDWSDVNRKTSIVAQRGDIGSANAVKSMINLGQVVSDSTGDIDSDITVRVGEDWLMQVDPTWQRLPYDGPR